MKKRSFWALSVLMVLISVVLGCGGGGGGSSAGNGNPNDPTGSICEGQQSPIAIQVGVPYSGQVCGNNNYSMYTFNTTATGSYTVTVSNISSGAALSYSLFTGANYSLPVGTCLQSSSDQFSCSHNLSASTTYDLSTYNTATAGTFTLTVTAPVSTVVTGSVPAAPQNVLATAGTNQATISWSAVTGAVGYNLYYSTTAGFDKTSQGVTQVVTVTSPKIVQSLTAGTNYFFRVSAYNIYGESVLSSQTGATPTAPVTSGAVPLTWDFVDGTLQDWSVTGTWAVMQDVGNGGYLLTDSPTSFYANNSNYSATSPSFDLTSASAPKMYISQTYQIGAGDAAYVEISTDNGSTWTALNGTGYTGNTAGGWQTPSFDLTAYKAFSTCKIRLRIQADATTNSGGWFVKYVQLTAN